MMATGQATYRLCPRCGRSVSATTPELFCINDGERLLERCDGCQAQITSPHAQFCGVCGGAYSQMALAPPQRTLRRRR